MDLKEQEILGDRIAEHWYYRSKLAALRRWTRHLQARELIDVGAGSGFFSRALLEATPLAAATCVDPGYDADTEVTVAGKPLRFRRQLDSSAAGLVLMMDVLEHVDDDVALLRDYVGRVPSGARFVITVPAFQFLWSGHDLFLEHRRRYTLPQVEAVARSAGLTVEKGAYFFGAVFPLAAATRLLGRLRSGGAMVARSQMREQGPAANMVLQGACMAELPLFPLNRLFGLTAFVLAAKP